MGPLRVAPLPGLWTINRTLKRAGCIQPRSPYAPKGVHYPDLTAGGQPRLHQADLVGSRYLQGGTRFLFPPSVDLPAHRVTQKSPGAVIEKAIFWVQYLTPKSPLAAVRSGKLAFRYLAAVAMAVNGHHDECKP